MRRRMKFVLIVAAAVTAIFLLGFKLLGFPRWSWHQKLTVTVSAPDGIKTASAVSAARWDMPPEWFRIGDSGGGHGAGALKGEAVTLQLAPNRYLFAVLKGYSAETAVRVFADPPLQTDNRREYMPALNRISSVRETRELPASQYPLLVTFGDIKSPMTLVDVAPSDLAAIFGAGYSLTSITLSITDEPATEGRVAQVLPWLESHKGRVKATDKKYAHQLTAAETVDAVDFVHEGYME